jgi:hypothetical protein
VLLKRSSAVALCVGLALLAGCRRQVAHSSDLTITHEVSPQPPRVGVSAITFKLTDAFGKPVTGARITVEGNMSHAGMAPAFAEAREVEHGLYRATIELSMAGDWVVVAHVSLADGRKLDHQFEIHGVA